MTYKGDSFFNLPKTGSDFGFKKTNGSFERATYVPSTHAAYNRQSSYLRWLRGFEISQSVAFDNAWVYPFFYEIPVTGPIPEGQEVPQIPGVFAGYPTGNKELGMHWTGARLAGSLRFDNLRTTSSNGLPIEYVEVNDEFFNVKLEGNWSEENPLPPPLFISYGGAFRYPLVGDIFEDRILEQDGELITKDSFNPATGLRYGYMSAVLVSVQPYTGILRFRRTGSIWTSPDRVPVSPSPVGFTPGRWLSVAGRYACTCQDFTGRDYAFVSKLQTEARSGRSIGKYFPYTKPRQVKIGRNERIVSTPGSNQFDLRAQITVGETPVMEVFQGTRDSAGVYEDFGVTYTNNGVGPPIFNDYRTDSNGNIIYQSDMWTIPLDEMRYCKHIYALRFEAGELIPEPSDYPIGITLSELEAMMKRERKRTDDMLMTIGEYGASFMDVPPYNCRSQMMIPIITKLFNVPSSLIRIDGFVMQDPITGESYRPTL